MIVPVADYGDVVYHSLMTDKMDYELDRAQNKALRCIYGPRIGGKRLREMAGVTTLRERRIKHCDTFAGKCASSERYSSWFPRRQAARSTRRQASGKEPYLESFARCERLQASPLHYFRRRLNGKIGKEYGKRYKEYRED